MIVTYKRLLVDIFLTHSLSKSLAFCKFASVNFEPCFRSLLKFDKVDSDLTLLGSESQFLNTK